MADNNGAAGKGGGTATVEQVRVQTREAEQNRCREILSAAERMSAIYVQADAQVRFRSMANEAIAKGDGVAAFNAALLAAIPEIRKAETVLIGMSEKDKKRWSMLRGIQLCIGNKGILPDSFERDIHLETLKTMGDYAKEVQGFLVPPDMIVSSRRGDWMNKRDLNVTNASQGGDFVQTTILTPIIELLRNRMVTQRLGIQTLSGLQGNIAIPRQTGAATAYTLAEQATLLKSTQVINQVSLSPKRVGAWNSYSKQLLLQSSVDVENFVRDDLMKVLAIKLDYLILQGAGGSAPIGVKYTTGIAAVTFGGPASWPNLIQFETALALANADLGRMAYVTTPDVRGKLKSAPKTGNQFPIFIWEKGDFGDGSNDGEVNGYRAAVTNQIDSSQVCFGNWEDDILAMWGGYDVIVDPYTTATSATVNITVNTFVDNCVRHPASFAWSTDSGAQ